MVRWANGWEGLVAMAANSLSAMREFFQCQIAQQAKWECPSARRDGSEWPRASKMGLPALSAMAANGQVQAKWEYPSAQRDGSKWPRASKMGVPALSAMAVPDLARTLDTMPVTFAKMGLRPSFKLQYGPYGWCSFSPGRVLNDIGRNTTPASIP